MTKHIRRELQYRKKRARYRCIFYLFSKLKLLSKAVRWSYKVVGNGNAHKAYKTRVSRTIHKLRRLSVNQKRAKVLKKMKYYNDK